MGTHSGSPGLLPGWLCCVLAASSPLLRGAVVQHTMEVLSIHLTVVGTFGVLLAHVFHQITLSSYALIEDGTSPRCRFL